MIQKLIRTVFVAVAILCSAISSNAIAGNTGNNSNSESKTALVLRGTNRYVSNDGNDCIVLYQNGKFQLRSGSAVVLEGKYSVEDGEIEFTVGDATFYGKTSGPKHLPSSITFVFDGVKYYLYLKK